jgi:hypothetical protein
VAYQLNLPESLSAVHDVFHVSQLKKCLRVPEEQLPTEDLEVQEDLTYIENPTQILETALVEPPKLFQLKCPCHASEAATHLNQNNPSVPQI